MSDVCVCMRDVISEFNSEIEGSLAFCALMLFLCCILYLMCLEVVCMWSVSFRLGCCVCLREECEDGVFSVYIWWWLNVREISLRVCSELCPVCFPIVRECVSVLL